MTTFCNWNFGHFSWNQDVLFSKDRNSSWVVRKALELKGRFFRELFSPLDSVVKSGSGTPFLCGQKELSEGSHRIHGAGIYANIGGILMGSMLPYIAAPWILWGWWCQVWRGSWYLFENQRSLWKTIQIVWGAQFERHGTYMLKNPRARHGLWCINPKSQIPFRFHMIPQTSYSFVLNTRYIKIWWPFTPW